LKVISIPIEGNNSEKATLLVTFKDGELIENSSFIAKIESFDKEIDFDSKKLKDQSFEGKYTSYNVSTKVTTFTKQFNYSPDNNETSRGCLRMEAESMAGFEVCSSDNVGNCVGYKMCAMGTFETVACYTTFPVCMIALALDCQTELCWDADSSNNYIY
jgi:hypothetical protein